MQLRDFGSNRLQRLFILVLFTMCLSVQAAEKTLHAASGASEVMMGKIDYALPDNLGTLTLQLPMHWVGARADGVEVLWIDQNGGPFKDNVTLTIRGGNKVADSNELLNKAMSSIVNSVEHSTRSHIQETQDRRLISFERTVSGQEITQTILVIYTESAEKSYLLTLNHSRQVNADPIDLSQVRIN